MSQLMIFKISRLFPNTLSGDGNYALLNIDNLMQPIQVHRPQKQKSFSELFFCIFEIKFKF